MRKIQCNVLIVGGGGAGLRAAIAAKEKRPEAKVVLVTKGKLGESGVTATACSDRMAFHATLEHTEPGGKDAWMLHARDIYEIGGEVSDANLASILARNAADAFHYLDKLGVPFVKKDGKAVQFITDGSDYARACFTGPYTAVHIEQALVRKIRELDIMVIEHCMITRLLTKKGELIGAFGLDMQFETQESVNSIYVFETPNVILATGGAGEIFRHNVYPEGMTGDGYAVAYEAGAELVNMEFIQLGLASTKTKLNCSGSMMRAVPRIVNDSGEEFLAKYFPKEYSLADVYNFVFQKGASWPVTYEHTTHIIDIAIYKETQKGKRVYLDYSKNPENFDFEKLSEKNKQMYKNEMSVDLGYKLRIKSPLNRLKEINQPSIDWLKARGIDLEQGDMVEVAVCGQHFQGGIRIGEQGNTCIPGLYAIGECAGGQHGANRPGGNALLDGQVFGKIAGEAAVIRALGTNIVEITSQEINKYKSELLELISNKNGIHASELKKQIQEIMTDSASIVRTENKLLEALTTIRELKVQKIVVDKDICHALETKMMLIVSEMVLNACITRKESRGPHLFFERYEDNIPVGRRDPEWQHYLVIKKEKDGMMICKKKPVNRFV